MTKSGLAQDVPLLYDVEHTGADFAGPVLPLIDDLPIVRPLPYPFELSDGCSRSTEFKDWSRRQAEIKREIKHYGIGKKPVRPKYIKAESKDDTLTVHVT